MLRDDGQTHQLLEDSARSASEAGLRFVSDDENGITRHPRGKYFSYRSPSGAPMRDAETMARIRQLAIPPAWTDVWTRSQQNGHIRATGRDDRGPKQYRY